MKITGFIWLRDIVDKLDWKHKLQPEEIEELFANRPQYRWLEKGKIESEDVYAAYGRSDAGRYLTVIFIRKVGQRALIVSARAMDDKERRQYGRK